MKKYLYLAAAVLAMAACQPKENNNPDGPVQDSVIPQKIEVADAFQEYFMNENESAELRYTVSPSNVNVSYTVEWESSDKNVLTVDKRGNVTALAQGSATVTASIPEYPEVKPAEAHITVLAPAKVGDYIYSDGSWGSEPNPSGKSVIAVVYWVGNASLFDPILEQDYPNCSHGLAMSLKQGKAEQWMKDWENYFFNTDGELDAKTLFFNMGNSPLCDNSGSLTEWGIVHSSYADKIRPYFENKDLWAGSGFPGLGGYTYTAVLEQYTREYPNAGQFPFQFYINAMNLVKDIEAPLTTSRWYLPSIFEAALMVNTALNKPSDFNNDKVDEGMNPLVQHNNANVAVMNAALGKVTGADLLPTESQYAIASATDTYMPFSECKGSSAPELTCSDYFECIYICQDPSGEQADVVVAREKRWDDWLKENAGDKYEEYKAQTDMNKQGFNIKDRYAVFLTIKGYDPAYSEDIGGIAFMLALNIGYAAPYYANVGVADGLRHIQDPGYSSVWDTYSGVKGKDNEYDVVRAIIAF